MSGIRSDAGEYSSKYRIIPGCEELTLTDPRDVPEELERWTKKYQTVKTLKDIAEAHAHFELIHPFGDGNTHRKSANVYTRYTSRVHTSTYR